MVAVRMKKAVALLMIFIIRSCAAPTATLSSTTFPEFQELNIKETIAGTKTNIGGPPRAAANNVTINSSSSYNYSTSGGTWKVKVVHRDEISSQEHYSSSSSSSNGGHTATHHTHLFHARMKRDTKRVAHLMRRLTPIISKLSNTTTPIINNSNSNSEMEEAAAAFGSEVVSGMEQGSGEYFVRIGVGSPPRSQYMVIDSGSDIVWVQCQPCSQCYHQSDPIFDPAHSASFTGVSCSSSVCGLLQNPGCHAGRCRYEASYGDGSYTEGTLALETITLGRTLIRNVAIGCGHMNRGMFVGAAGLLGLGGGPMSFVSQLAGQTGGAFTYCLVSRTSTTTSTNAAAAAATDHEYSEMSGGSSGGGGTLEFGRGAMPVGAAWVPLIRNSRAPSFYFVGLVGLGVGGVRVPISEDVFGQTQLGYGGVVMDTGTAVTRFPTSAYEALRDSFSQQTANIPRLPSGVSIFDTCYDLNGFVSVRVPTVSFYFSGTGAGGSGPVLVLPAKNFLMPVDDKGTFCFAFAPSGSGLSIIGNIQQEGIQISFDGANGFVGFGPNIC